MRKNIFRILANSILGGILILVWTRFVDLEEIVEILKTANVRFLALFFVLFIASGFLKALRFKVLLSRFQISVRDVTALQFLSQFLSFMIPLRLGEITKGVYLHSQYDLPFGKTLVWVFIDRFLDLWVVLFMIGILFPLSLGFSGNLPYYVIGTLVVFTLATFVFIKNATLAKKFTTFLSTFIPVRSIKKYFISFTHTIIEGFEILTLSPFRALTIFIVTAVAFILDGLGWFVIFLALGQNFSAVEIILGNLLTALTFIIPAAPGYVGSAEAAGLAIFGGVLGINPNIASAATVLFHILIITSLPVLGVISLYFLKFDLSLVWQKLRG